MTERDAAKTISETQAEIIARLDSIEKNQRMSQGRPSSIEETQSQAQLYAYLEEVGLMAPDGRALAPKDFDFDDRGRLVGRKGTR